MTTKTLVIKGKGGLGNRILSAVSGLVYADLSGRTPVIDWRDGSYAPLGINAYPLLFQSPITGEIVDEHSDICPAIWTGKLHRQPQDMIDAYMPQSHSNPWGYRRLCVDLKRLDHPQETAVYWSYLPKLARMQHHLRRDPRFAHRGEREILADYLGRYFTPNARVRRALSQMRRASKRPSIGVHIRFTDRKIPLRPVLATLRRLTSCHPDAIIFLATDNAQIVHHVGASTSRTEAKAIAVMTSRASLIRDHWPKSHRGAGIFLMWLWSATRYLATRPLIASNRADRRARAAHWAAVWTARKLWLQGYD